MNSHRQLIDACYKGNLEGIKKLVEQGADIDYQKNHMLNLCGIFGDMDIFNYLVELGADIHTKTKNDAVLYGAICYGHLEIIKFYDDQGPNRYNSNIKEILKLAKLHKQQHVINYYNKKIILEKLQTI